MPEKIDRGRSPLRACENWEVNIDHPSPNEDSLILLENKRSLSPISPILQENQHATYTPLSMRRSTTYPVSGTAVYDELLKDVKETSSIMPLCDYSVETKLGTLQSSDTNSACTPEQSKRWQVAVNHRKLLSPDSFVNNTYELTEQPVRAVPILSPDQFLKENQLVQPTSQVPKSMSVSPSEESCMPRTIFPKQKEKMQVVTFSVEPQIAKKSRNNVHDRKMATPSYVTVEQKISSYRKTDKNQVCCFQKEQLKKRPVLSNTVTKSKPDSSDRKGLEMLKPHSRKCLSNAIQQCVDIPETEKSELLPRLPVIEPVSGEAKCFQVKTGSACLVSSSYQRKRKCGGYLEDTISGCKEYIENFETKKILVSCVENENQSAFKRTIPKTVNKGKQSPKKRMGTLSQKSKTVRRSKNTVPVAQSHLTFVKPLKTDVPRHPMPFAAKNMFYDERWIEKQQRGFTWWLNFVLTPDDFTVKMDTSQVNAASLILGTESYHKCSVPKAPTKEEASLRAYTARCKLNKLRRSACRLFTSDEMVKAIKRLEVEIEAKRLLVRKDRHLWKDIGERQKILNWLLCYNPLWLRIGLEAVYGELIALESNSDVMGLAMFILNRLLWNPDIAAEYRHATVPHLYRDGHEEALSKFTLKKLLLLVCFLDRAKLSRIIDHDPCLFCKDAKFKSSKELLLAFSRDFLSGEGDLSRHLGFLGFPVNHVQTPLDEFDFAVTNLAVDLQCGIRLVRALELLSSDWSLSKNLRVPAISRLQKMHNVKIALQVLKDHGIQLKDDHGAAIEAKDIVDRHREKTFALLWKTVFAFQVNVSLDMDQLKEEIGFLNNMYEKKAKATALASSAASKVRKDSNSFYSSENYSEKVKLLMDWVNAVCRSYNVKAENFTVSFSDGRVLCFLIHHYHPCYIPLEAVCQRTTQTVECTKSGSIALNSSSESDSSLNILNGSFDQTITTSVLYKELLDNEKKNFQLINAAVSDLGGVPAMIHHSDMSNTIPDEKVVITYVSFLCSRLLDLSKEIRAARLIQSTWRNYRFKVKLAQKWQEAAVVFQAWYRMKRERRHFLMMRGAATTIQILYRAYREQTSQRQKFLQTKKAAVCLQATFRGYKLRKTLKRQNMAAVKIQAVFRAYTVRVRYQALIQASRVIQKWYRASKASSKIRASFLKTKAAVILLQAAWRGWQVRKWTQEQHAAAITIQSAFRKYKALQRFRMVRNAALTLQQHYRAKVSGAKQRQEYVVLYKQIVKLQAAWRGNVVRRQIQRQHRAAVVIQSYYRMHVNQAELKCFRQAAITIQRWYRAAILASSKRQEYLALKQAAVRIQAIYRGVKTRQKLEHMHWAAIRIQAMFRMHQDKVRFTVIKLSAGVIQRRYRALCRGRKERKSYLEMKNSSLILQAAYRGMRVRQELKTLRQSATTIQSFYRMYRQRKSFLKLVGAAKLIQQWYRGCKNRNIQLHKYRQMKSSALRIQSAFRGMRARLHLRKMHAAATIIQRSFKTFLQRRHFLTLRAAAVTVQWKYRAAILSKQQHARYQTMKLAAILIQRRYRALCRGRNERKHYLELRNSSLILQAAYRGMRVRQELKTLRQSATTIQSFYRMYRRRKSFLKLVGAAKLIQQWYCGCKNRNIQLHKYRQMKSSALRIQSAFRGMRARLHLRKMHAAATIIQRSFKTFLQRRHFLTLRAAAVTIQQKYRATVLAKQQRGMYLCLHKAAVVLQSTFRGQRVRKSLKQMHRASTVIQSSFRMHIAYTQFRAMKFACVAIQQRYRAYREAKRVRELYLKHHRAALVLQAAYRGMKTRHTLKKHHDAATIIQSHYRKHRQQCHYRKTRWAAQVIQIRVRANKLSRIAVQQYSSVKTAAVCIQKAFRRMKARRCLKRHQAAVVLQRNFKMKKQRRSYLALKAAAVVLQRRYRALILARRLRQEYILVRAAIVSVQSFYRGFKIRKEVECMHLAARAIQALFRMHRARLSYQRLRYAALTIQNCYRSYLKAKQQRTAYLTLRRSAILIQATYRGMRTRQELNSMHASATAIQSLYRMHVQRKHYKLLHCSVLIIQSAYRRAVAHRKGKEARAARKIQSSFCVAADHRMFSPLRTETLVLQSQYGSETREQSRKCWETALLIQKCYPSHLTVKLQSLAYLQILKSIIIIQALVRGFMVRRRLCKMKRSAIKIQAFFRGYKVRQLAAQNPSMFPEAWFIRCRTMKEYRAIEKATRVIQSYQRAKKQRIWFLKMKASTILIQRKWRATVAAKIALQNFLVTRAAVVVIQSAYRRHSARKQFKKVLEERQQTRLLSLAAAVYHHIAATKIQRAYRSHLHLKRADLQLASVLYIQRWYRAKLQRRHYLLYREKIIKLQRLVRRWMHCRSAAVIQEHQGQKTPSNGIIKFQALWRGYSWRKKTDTAKTKALRDSLLIATKESKEEKKLCNRTSLAIDHLLKYKHYSYILAALKDLEVVTRLSPVCCENMAQSEAVFTIFTLIRSCNRSVPCMDVIRYSVQVLLNLSKYDRTTQAVYEVGNSIETLLDLLQMYRERAGDKTSEKGGSIFTKTCCLFALLAQDLNRAYEIRSDPRVVTRLQSLFKLTARKHQMDAQRMIAKQKSGAYKNGHSCVSTPRRTRLVSTQRPEWVLRKDNMQEIVDPLQAIQMVLDTLGISCN
ncbi:abnormal spindle-like microcephaly-associated protein isoform X1 [Varanus komodoensis]|uniref:abnormal spindle-like microcephaly-associated protein isoform X1 n=1 Tax=Varanus komodoensis TaxID=61221 RepID=UPI001CF7EBD1|nr:abnormal spindle-like microcephaly-associated protein isoform X1 [Varanus komodoensis]